MENQTIELLRLEWILSLILLLSFSLPLSVCLFSSLSPFPYQSSNILSYKSTLCHCSNVFLFFPALSKYQSEVLSSTKSTYTLTINKMLGRID